MDSIVQRFPVICLLGISFAPIRVIRGFFLLLFECMYGGDEGLQGFPADIEGWHESQHRGVPEPPTRILRASRCFLRAAAWGVRRPSSRPSPSTSVTTDPASSWRRRAGAPVAPDRKS